MLFDTTLRKELARSFGATVVVILTIVLTMMLIRTVGQAAVGKVAPQDVLLLMAYTGTGHLPTILTLSLFVAITYTLGRVWRDSEMVIWNASGVGLLRFLRPVMATSWPVLLVITSLLFVGWPWVNQRAAELRERYAQRSDISRVTPGVFQTSRDGRSVFFIDRDSPEAVEARSVFILSQPPGREGVTTARSGQLELRPDGRYLVLNQGFRSDTRTDTGWQTESRFATAEVRIGEPAEKVESQTPPRAKPTVDLLINPTPADLGELAWRLGLALAAFNMVLLGVGLSASNPRRPNNWNLLFALLTFIVYFNLINLSQSWVRAGTATLPQALLSLHGGMLVLAVLLLLMRQQAVWLTALPWQRWRRPAAA
jgi:lipopolysaccharide export system permease protein